MTTYDKAQIGRCLAWLGEDFVYLYGEDSVIKFSKFDWIAGRDKARHRFLEDYPRTKQHFGTYILDTELAISTSGSSVAKIQRKIVGRPLQLSDLRHEKVRSQCREFIALIDSFTPSNVFIDLIGAKGVWTGGFSNIFLTPENDLIIIDITLIGLKRYPVFARPFMYVPLTLIRKLQEHRLQGFRLAMV